MYKKVYWVATAPSRFNWHLQDCEFAVNIEQLQEHSGFKLFKTY